MVASSGAGRLTEEEARDESRRLAGPHSFARIERFIPMLAAEAKAQNLVSQASLESIWSRHILDSLQLVAFARDGDRRWADIGTGAGFPGLIVAMLGRFEVTLIEPRRQRAQFLGDSIAALGLKAVAVAADNARTVKAPSFDIVSARAVASTVDLLKMSAHLAESSTRFIFPKGARAESDIETARRGWHGMFHVEQSLTNPKSGIVVIDKVRAK